MCGGSFSGSQISRDWGASADLAPDTRVEVFDRSFAQMCLGKAGAPRFDFKALVDMDAQAHGFQCLRPLEKRCSDAERLS